MSRIVLIPDPETMRRLIAAAVAEERPIPMQAAVILRRALGLPVPGVPTPDTTAPKSSESETTSVP